MHFGNRYFFSIGVMALILAYIYTIYRTMVKQACTCLLWSGHIYKSVFKFCEAWKSGSQKFFRLKYVQKILSVILSFNAFKAH